MGPADVPLSPASGIRNIFLQSSGRLRSGWRFALFFLAVAGASAGTLLLLRIAHLLPPRGEGGAPAPLRQLPQVAAVLAVVVAVSGAFLWGTERRKLSTLGFPFRPSALPAALLGLLAGALPVALSVAIFRGLGAASVRPSESAPTLLAPAGIAAIAVTGLASALEEMLWRGYPFQVLIEGAGRWIAVLLTALFWALGHADNPGANAAGVLELLLSGALLGWIVIRTGSLWFAIGYHVAWNVVAAHVFGLITSGLSLGSAAFRTTLTGPVWLTGGSYGFEASLVTGALDVLCLSGALLLSRHVPRSAEATPYFEKRPAAALPGAFEGPPAPTGERAGTSAVPSTRDGAPSQPRRPPGPRPA